jgi:hypothetical protein
MSRRESQRKAWKKWVARGGNLPQKRWSTPERMAERAEKLARALRRAPTPSLIFDACLAGQEVVHHSGAAYHTVFTALLREETASEGQVVAFRALLGRMDRHVSGLLTPSRARLFWEIAAIAPVRPLSSWNPSGKSRRRRLDDVLGHLLTRYPVPGYLSIELLALTEGSRVSDTAIALLRARLSLLVLLGCGGSMKKAQQQGLVPASLTRRMLHEISVDRSARSLMGAIRSAQVRAFGGSTLLVRAIRETFLGQEAMPDEPRWASIIQWLCNQPGLEPRLVSPLLDYLREEARQEGWSIKGRSLSVLLRGMQTWHQVLGGGIPVQNYVFSRSGLEEASFQVLCDEEVQVWTVTEIYTAHELAREGRLMSHCVYVYGRRILEGKSAIWSVRCDQRRALTVEVNLSRSEMVQARGKANRMPTSHEQSVVQCWAALNGLTCR